MIDGGGTQWVKLQLLFNGIPVLSCSFIPFDIQRTRFVTHLLSLWFPDSRERPALKLCETWGSPCDSGGVLEILPSGTWTSSETREVPLGVGLLQNRSCLGT